VLFQIGLHCFLDGQVWNQLVLLQRLSRHRVEIANLVKMFKKYSPLICYATGCDHWVSKYLESYLTTKVIGHLGFHHGISSFKMTELESKRFDRNKVDYKYCFYISWCIGKCCFAEDL